MNCFFIVYWLNSPTAVNKLKHQSESLKHLSFHFSQESSSSKKAREAFTLSTRSVYQDCLLACFKSCLPYFISLCFYLPYLFVVPCSCGGQLVKGAPDSLLRSLHVQKDPKNYNYIKVGGQVKVRTSFLFPWALWGTLSLCLLHPCSSAPDEEVYHRRTQ